MLPDFQHRAAGYAFKTEGKLTTSKFNGRRLRLLVAIASFGEKNLELLKSIIARYRRMEMEVDVAVVSNNPKELGPEVKVLVGLPSKNPWSLPFAHKPLFVENVDRYDLFIYSEDDMGVTEGNIRAFLRATEKLESNEIAGFLRYEVGSSGAWHLPDVHGAAHWKPESVKVRGDYTIAEFTNEHAAFYLLTQSQLRRAIASGGFLREPCEGRYDMLCTAATDPYTNCGFRKVICVSGLEDFLIHHLSNRYVGQLGLELSLFKQQVETLQEIARQRHPVSTLCEVESKLLRGHWSKSYYEEPTEELFKAVPHDAKTILSIGCGWGKAEYELKRRGAHVTAIPLDSVIGDAAARLGIEVVHGSFDECIVKFKNRKFDCVLMSNLLHLLPNPQSVLERLSSLVGDKGKLLVVGPNFNFLPVLIRRTLGSGEYKKLRAFDESGITLCSPGKLARHVRSAGLKVGSIHWPSRSLPGDGGIIANQLGRFAARNWSLQATR